MSKTEPAEKTAREIAIEKFGACDACAGTGVRLDNGLVGRKLMAKRIKANISIVQQADLMGISNQYLSYLERGIKVWTGTLIAHYNASLKRGIETGVQAKWLRKRVPGQAMRRKDPVPRKDAHLGERKRARAKNRAKTGKVGRKLRNVKPVVAAAVDWDVKTGKTKAGKPIVAKRKAA